MSRDASGNYSLPLSPVVTGTTIEASWANTTLDDIKAALTDSLSRSGNGSMQVPMKLVDGTISLPGINWSSETSSGLYRAAAGDLRFSVQGADKWRATAAGFQFYANAQWNDPVEEAASDGKTYGRKDGAWQEVVVSVGLTDLNLTQTDVLVGRDTAGAGEAEEITVGGGLEFTGAGGLRRSAITGDVSVPAGSNTATLADNSVTLAKLGHQTQGQIIYFGASGVPAVLSPGTAGQVLKTGGPGADPSWQSESGGYTHPNHSGDVVSVGDGAQTIQPNVVTFAKMQDIATARLLGRVTAATGDPEALTGTQATTLLDVFTSSLKGLAPASGGGTVNFLRADGTWAEPPGGTGGGGDAFKNWNITSTDSGYTWSASTTVIADIAEDDITFVAGSDIDIEGDNALKAIRISIESQLNSVSSIYNTGLQVGYSTSAYMDFNSSSFDVVFTNPEFRFESDGDFHADGNVFAYSSTTSSDRRLKEDIRPIQSALDKVLELDGCTFTMKRDGARRAGLIAQDVELVLPEAVRLSAAEFGSEGQHLQLDYNAVVGLLVNAVKELSLEVAELRSQLGSIGK